MTPQLTAQRLALFGLAVLICALYLTNLTATGLISPDEPRYAEIGRAMAHSGDWITPRLWGHPWFEKPALLYWMTGLGFVSGLGPELAPRLPVALLSVAFLIFFGSRVSKLWDRRIAIYATTVLATSAGWLAYSHVAVTDLPLAVFFTAALLFAMGADNTRDRVWAAVALGLATLAKGLVPLVLFAPVLALDFRRLREWLRPAPVLAFCAVCLPWYILCTLRNGTEFLSVFFLKHTFGRFYSPALQHGQGPLYYFPVLILFLYPWFPLLALIRPDWRDRRIAIAGGVFAFGFLFFSASVNKLPGYILPLMPALCLLIGIGLSRLKTRWILAVPIALLGALPAARETLPAALAHGIRSSPVNVPALVLWIAGFAALGIAVVWFSRKGAFATAGILAAGAFLWFGTAVLPAVDAAVSARGEWLRLRPDCVQTAARGVTYGLEYYAERELTICAVLDQTGTRVVR